MSVVSESMFAGSPELRRGIYTASKTRHARIWKTLRAAGQPIISTWIDEAGEGESADLHDLWERCIKEARSCKVLIVFKEPEDVLKGAWVEIGAALAAGIPVYAVGLDGFTLSNYRGITHFPSIAAAFAAARGIPDAAPTALDEIVRLIADGNLTGEYLIGAIKNIAEKGPVVLAQAAPDPAPNALDEVWREAVRDFIENLHPVQQLYGSDGHIQASWPVRKGQQYLTLDFTEAFGALFAATHPSQYGGMGEAVAWQRRNSGNDWTNLHDCSDQNLRALKKAGWEIRPLYAAPQPPANAGGTEATLRMVAGLFAESVHETYTREEVVSIVEDMMRIGRPTSSIPSTQSASPTVDDVPSCGQENDFRRASRPLCSCRASARDGQHMAWCPVVSSTHREGA